MSSERMLIAFNFIHHIQYKKKPQYNSMCLKYKLHLSKVYDLVDYIFLENVFLNPSFPSKWIFGLWSVLHECTT